MSGWTAATYIAAAGLATSVAATGYSLAKGSPKIKAPAPPPAPPPSAAPATLASAVDSSSSQAANKRELGGLAAGFDGTVATSPLGTSGSTNTSKSSLLGGG